MKKYRFPTSNSDDKEEKQLGKSLDYYVHMDEDFRNILKEKFNFKFRDEKKLEKQQKIDDFVKEYGYFPKGGKNSNEQELAQAVQLYVCRGSSSFDETFAKKHQHTPTYAQYTRVEKQKNINIFVEKFGYLPNSISKNMKERELGIAWGAFRDQNSNSFDEDFAKKHKNTLTYLEWKNIETAKACIIFYVEHGIPPTKSAKDKNERKLGAFISGIKRGRTPILDETLRQTILTMKNVHELKREKSGLPLGVSKSNGKFQAHISINKRLIHLGTFNAIEQAQAAVEKAKKEKR